MIGQQGTRMYCRAASYLNNNKSNNIAKPPSKAKQGTHVDDDDSPSTLYIIANYQQAVGLCGYVKLLNPGTMMQHPFPLVPLGRVTKKLLDLTIKV